MDTGSSVRRHKVRALSKQILQAYEKIEDLSQQCAKHPRQDWPRDADGCPCINRLDWSIARNDEAIHRLRSNCRMADWWIWYLRSSLKNPLFPAKSLDTFAVPHSIQTIADRYKVALKRSHFDHKSPHCYKYQDGTTRPGAGPEP